MGWRVGSWGDFSMLGNGKLVAMGIFKRGKKKVNKQSWILRGFKRGEMQDPKISRNSLSIDFNRNEINFHHFL